MVVMVTAETGSREGAVTPAVRKVAGDAAVWEVWEVWEEDLVEAMEALEAVARARAD